MSFQVLMPKEGLTMVEGTITEWKVKEGAQVAKDDVVMVFENEKTEIDCEATGSGLIHILAKEGDVVPVGVAVAVIGETKEEYDQLCAQGGGAAAAAPAAPAEAAPTAAAPTAAAPAAAAPAAAAPVSGGRVRATGYAKKLAAEAGVDLTQVKGTGINGRIVAKDVQTFVANRPVAAETVVEAPTIITLSNQRKMLARNMRKSASEAVACTVAGEVDVTDLLALRKKLVDMQDLLGCKVTVGDLLSMATIKMLKRHPLLNANFDGENITCFPYVNLGMAVGMESGLMVPVLKNADKLSLAELSMALRDMTTRTRNGELRPGEQAGGTCTITNVGMYPIDVATPVFTVPQVGIVGFGRSTPKWVLHKGEWCGRTMMNVMLTWDHRVFEGYEAGKILGDMQQLLENPELILAK